MKKKLAFRCLIFLFSQITKNNHLVEGNSKKHCLHQQIFYNSLKNNIIFRTCNNEVLKMQKLGVADVQLQNMQVSLRGGEEGHVGQKFVN